MSKLLLVIDLQQGFRYPESAKLIPTILKLIQKFPGQIVFTKFINKPQSLFEKQLHWTKFQHREEQEIFPEFDLSTALVIPHTGYTVVNTRLKSLFLQTGISEVYLCGIYTDVCLIKAAMDLFDLQLETFVLKDACNSLHGEDSHQAALKSLSHILGQDHILRAANWQ